MKIAELIKDLELIYKKHGDIDVVHINGEITDSDILYEVDRYFIKKTDSPYEIHAHPKDMGQDVEEIKKLCDGPYRRFDPSPEYFTRNPSDYYTAFIESDRPYVMLD